MTIKCAGAVGGIVGEIYVGPIMQNCSVMNTVLKGDYTGGIAAKRANQGYYKPTFTNCSVVDTVIEGGYSAGGIIAENYQSNLKSCVVMGSKISAVPARGETSYAGGLCGYGYFVDSITDCIVLGCEIYANSARTCAYGALLGRIHATTSTDITDTMYEIGIVSGDEKAVAMGDMYNADGISALAHNEIGSDTDDALILMLQSGQLVTVNKGDAFEIIISALPGTKITDKTKLSFSFASSVAEVITLNAAPMSRTLTGKALNVGLAQVRIHAEEQLTSNDFECTVLVIDPNAPQPVPPNPTPSSGGSGGCSMLPLVFVLLSLLLFPIMMQCPRTFSSRKPSAK